MHGRVKVRTTDENERIKLAEKNRKATEFKKNYELLLQKRKDGELDEDSSMLAGGLLLKHPDVYTLWNIKKEMLLQLDKDDKRFLEELQKELHLTESCLKENPKSYCVWFHRVWVIKKIPKPDWKRELDLCAKCLNLDERNFHCWDYRRFVVKAADIADISELEFTTSKIMNNLSNYSSWHYRSKLINFRDTNECLQSAINKNKYKEELDLIINAVFTDPSDSSTWFYQKWLLNYWKPVTKLWKIIATNKTITAVFHNEVSASIIVLLESNRIKCDWKSANGKRSSTLWFSILDEEISDSNFKNVSLQFENTAYNLKQSKVESAWIYESDDCENDNLKDLLKNYKMLSAMEPSNKWVKLITTQIMQKLDPIRNYKQIVQNYQDLIKLDPLRSNYYADIGSMHKLGFNLLATVNQN